MKKAAIVIADIQLGGGQRAALNFASALSKEHEVTLIVFHTVDQQYEVPYRLVNIECPGKHSVVGKAYNVLKRALMLRRHFAKEQYDYIYGFMETANFPTVIASPKAILSVHCNPHEYNRYEYSRPMLLKDCQKPMRIYTHSAPYMGGPERIKNTNGAGDAALAAILHDLSANVYHKNTVAHSIKHQQPALTYSSLSQMSKYANRASYEVLVQHSPRLSRGLPEREDSLDQAYWAQ